MQLSSYSCVDTFFLCNNESNHEKVSSCVVLALCTIATGRWGTRRFSQWLDVYAGIRAYQEKDAGMTTPFSSDTLDTYTLSCLGYKQPW